MDYTTNRHEITVLLPNPFDEIPIAVFLEWSCCRRRRCSFVAKQKISPNLLIFGLKMFRRLYLRKQVPTLYVSEHKQQSYWGLKLQNHGLRSPLLHNDSFQK